MATGIALLPGVVFGLAAVIAWRSSRRYAALLGAAGLSWFAGDVLNQLLLVHRPVMIYAVLAYPVGRLRGRFAWFVVMVALAEAVFVPVGRSVLGMVGLAQTSFEQALQLDHFCREADQALVALKQTGFFASLRARLNGFFSR